MSIVTGFVPYLSQRMPACDRKDAARRVATLTDAFGSKRAANRHTPPAPPVQHLTVRPQT